MDSGRGFWQQRKWGEEVQRLALLAHCRNQTEPWDRSSLVLAAASCYVPCLSCIRLFVFSKTVENLQKEGTNAER